jgi:uncharacterized protein YjbJ (UPF0337 family)
VRGFAFDVSFLTQRAAQRRIDHGAGTSTRVRTLTRDRFTRTARGTRTMNKDRIEGSVEQAKGKVKEVAGKATGDAKLETEGKTQKAAGKVQNTIGGVKDAVKEAVDDK